MPSRALLIAAAARQACATSPTTPNSTTTPMRRSYHNNATASLKYPGLPNPDKDAASARSHSYTNLSSPPRNNSPRSPSITMPNDNHMFSANSQWANDVSRSEPEFFAASAKGQNPQLLWIGCADSRVPETIVMAAKPGDIFVHRNIANQFHLSDDSAQSVLTYAVDNLGVMNVAVVGHTCCGGAAACLAAAKAEPTTPNSPLSRWLTPMTSLARSLNFGEMQPDIALRVLVEENVKAQVANVIQSDTIVAAWKAGKNVLVHGWVYEIEKGTIRDLNITVGPGWVEPS